MQRSNAQSTDVIETVDRGTHDPKRWPELGIVAVGRVWKHGSLATSLTGLEAVLFEPATGVGVGGAKGEPQRGLGSVRPVG